MVKKASEVNIMERVARPFTKTLTPAAWGMVIGTMFAVSLAMVVVEGADNVGDGIDRVMRKLNADEAALSKAGVLPGSGEEGGDEDPMDDDDSNREGGGWSVFYGFMGLMNAAPMHEARRLPGACIVMGFGIFCLLFATTYCGATAALLINANEQLGTINDLAGILAVPDGKVCLMVSFERRFALRFPEFAGRLVPSITAQTVLQDFDDGKCIGALMCECSNGRPQPSISAHDLTPTVAANSQRFLGQRTGREISNNAKS